MSVAAEILRAMRAEAVPEGRAGLWAVRRNTLPFGVWLPKRKGFVPAGTYTSLQRGTDVTLRENRGECVDALDEIFATRSLDEWREKLDTMEGVWAPMQTPAEIHQDRQVLANGYLPPVKGHDGQEFRLAANPVQFDEASPELGPAPEHGQHTEEVLLDLLGMSWDELTDHKQSKSIL